MTITAAGLYNGVNYMNVEEKKTILVVDDEPDVLNYFSRILQDGGFNVITAENGFDALEKLKETKPDFISLDLVMPKKSGIRFYYELRKNRDWSRIPVMIVTAHAKDEFGKTDFTDMMEGKIVSGPETYLEKPVKPEKYVNTIRRILGLPEMEFAKPKKSPNEIKDELSKLIGDADVNKLQEALDLLKKKKDQ